MHEAVVIDGARMALAHDVGVVHQQRRLTAVERLLVLSGAGCKSALVKAD